MDIITRQKLIILIQLAKADHNFAAEERAFIQDIADRNKFPREELEELLDSTITFESLGALSKERKLEYLVDSLHLIMADGKIEPQEITFCQNIAVKLGYHKDVVTVALDRWPKIQSVDFSEWEIT